MVLVTQKVQLLALERQQLISFCPPCLQDLTEAVAEYLALI
jgi:hypothetical protein